MTHLHQRMKSYTSSLFSKRDSSQRISGEENQPKSKRMEIKKIMEMKKKMKKTIR
jgi:hypothetical protein